MPRIHSVITMLLVAAGLGAQETSSTPKGKVDGLVVNQVTGTPLAKATVTLVGNMARPMTGASGQRMGPNSYNAVTDRNGRFVVDQVEPGRYSVSAEHPGFVRTNNIGNAAASLVVGAGQSSTGLRLVLIPKGAISGRVTDEDGDP